MNKLVILSGTLCGADLWVDVERALVDSGVFAAGSIVYGDLTGGDTMERIAERVGEDFLGGDSGRGSGGGSDGEAGGGRLWVLGYSLGGVVAFEVAKRYQRRMAGLMLVCTKANGRNAEKDEALASEADYLERHGLGKVFDDILLPAYFGDTLAQHPRLARRVKQSGLNFGGDALREQRRSFQSRIDQHAHLRDISVPTLVVCGADDVLCTAEQSGRIAALLPRSVLYEYPGVGHALPWVCARRLAEQIAHFVRTEWATL